jgi:hypothetical protein
MFIEILGILMFLAVTKIAREICWLKVIEMKLT